MFWFRLTVVIILTLFTGSNAVNIPSLLDKRQTCTNSPTTRNCWTSGFDINTNTDTSWPNTGVTRTYSLAISTATMAPDGTNVQMMVVNGQYPGPAIYANWGDTLQVTVTNNLVTNGTGIHWHGVRQLNSNQMDGTPGVTECPIPPGGSRTYTWTATQYGTSWYHSHYSVQYGGGVLGPIIINGPTTSNWDIDVGALPLTDWYHTPVFTNEDRQQISAGVLTADNALVNGSMVAASGSGGKYSVTTLTPGKLHLLRIVNTGINQYFRVSIDNHPMTVVAADWTPIKPYTATSITLAIGQRYDVIINANQTVGNYWLRVATGGGGACDAVNSNANNIRSIIRYSGAAVANPTSTGSVATGCTDESPSKLVPWVNSTVPSGSFNDLVVGFSPTTPSGAILVRWQINGSAIMVDWNDPTLEYVINNTAVFPTSENLYGIGPGDIWSYWVISSNTAGPPFPHPIHLHGHRFYLLGAGTGAFTGSGLNFNNPPHRDTANLPGRGWLALAFQTDNPGAWLMHCHIAWHVSEGFGVQFLERRSEILSATGGSSFVQQGCSAWNTYEQSHTPPIAPDDSGL